MTINALLLISFIMIITLIIIFIYLHDNIDLTGTVVILDNVGRFPKTALFIVTDMVQSGGVKYLRCYSNEHGELYIPKLWFMNKNKIHLEDGERKYHETLKGYYLCYCGSKYCKIYCDTCWNRDAIYD
jgi:CDGSH-type Zn-finger protein